MKPISGTLRSRISLGAAIVLAFGLALAMPSAWATIQFMDDGALQNSRGGFDLPPQGTCPAAGLQGYPPTIDTRTECVALRLPLTGTACAAPNYSLTTGGVCNDLVNTTQGACETTPDRLWNPGTGICSVIMLYDDRNEVTCAKHGGTYVTSSTCIGVWIMPTRTSYTPALLTGNGPGDQCLRCHNSRTLYNNPRVRDTEDTMFMGHKNMSRKVTPGTPWGGPPFECTIALFTTEEACYDNGGNWVPDAPYPTDDSGNPFNWTSGTINVGGADRNLTWIYADWIAPRPRAIYKAPASTTQVCDNPLYTAANCVANGGTLVNNAGASYSCGRCHTTGWTSDSTIKPSTGIESKEPEASFPGLTWNRTSNAPADVVNLTGGVSGDPNKYSSWDAWGITCTRCHSSAIDTTNIVAGQTPTQYGAPVGMSTHHSNMTAPDNNSGVCTATQWTAEAQCTSGGGQWLTACSTSPTPNPAICTINAGVDSTSCGTAGGVWTDAPFCSNAYYTTQPTCTTNGFTWTNGWCKGADPTGSPLVCASGRTLRLNGTQAACQVAGATWSFTKCSVEGFCNKGTCSVTAYNNNYIECVAHNGTWTGYADPTSCAAAGGQFAYARDIIRCDDADGRWTGNNTNRGQMITSLCMGCHRQETGGLPYGATSTNGVDVDYTNTDPAGQLKVGQYHSTITFLSHPHGNQFLNSPHAKFATGTTSAPGRYPQIATGRFNFAMTGEYKSFFLTDGEAANTGNGCTGCHEVHTSVVAGEDPFREVCTDCHAGIYKKDLTKINHLWGQGTPMQDAATDESSACESCHMPGGMHLFRINADPSYSTFPVSAALATTNALNANTAPEGTYTSAGWVDLDAACGQCHGGGTSYAQTTGSITLYTTAGACTGAGGTFTNGVCSLSKVATVANATGFLVGERIRIANAGSYEYDEQGSERGDFDSYIAAVNTTTNTITVVGPPPISASGTTIVQNPRSEVQPGQLAPYYTKSQLALVAKGMHGSSGTNYAVTFSTAIDPSNSLKVNVDAYVDCGGTCPTLTYDWNWGDGSLPHGTADPDSHTYVAAGKYEITLIVRTGGLQVGAPVTQGVTVVAPNQAPIAAGSCAWNADTWTMVYTDTSSDPNDPNPANLQVIVDWGDGGAKTSVPRLARPQSVSKVYSRIGTFTTTAKAIDINGLSSTFSCTAVTPAYFTIGGTVKTSADVVIPGALVVLKKGLSSIASALTATNGTYSFSNLKPGIYSITVTKTGYGFGAAPQLSVTVGGSRSNADVVAVTTPLGVVSSKDEGMDNAN